MLEPSQGLAQSGPLMQPSLARCQHWLWVNRQPRPASLASSFLGKVARTTYRELTFLLISKRIHLLCSPLLWEAPQFLEFLLFSGAFVVLGEIQKKSNCLSFHVVFFFSLSHTERESEPCFKGCRQGHSEFFVCLILPADGQGHVQTPDTCLSKPPAVLHKHGPIHHAWGGER